MRTSLPLRMPGIMGIHKPYMPNVSIKYALTKIIDKLMICIIYLLIWIWYGYDVIWYDMDVDKEAKKNNKIIKLIHLSILYYFEIIFYYALKILERILCSFTFVCSILRSLVIRILMGIYLWILLILACLRIALCPYRSIGMSNLSLLLYFLRFHLAHSDPSEYFQYNSPPL